MVSSNDEGLSNLFNKGNVINTPQILTIFV